jgi:uncharacterized protein YkwD
MSVLSLVAPCAFGQSVPEAALWAGFSRVTGKNIGVFEASSLSGLRLDRTMTDVAPVLFHVWLTTRDPSGEGLVLVAAFQKAIPGAAIFAVTADSAARTRGLVDKAGLAATNAVSDGQNLIRALGGPSAPAWIFVAPGGEIVAYRLGRLESGLDGVKALFKAFPPATVASDKRGTTAWSTGAATVATPTAASVPAPGLAELNAGLTDSGFVQAIEVEIVAELNLARTQPKQYADLLRAYRKFIRGTYFERPGEVTVVLNEGVKAVDEAIAFLERQKPVPPLLLSKGLSLAAGDHAKDQGVTGQTGHSGSDRSTMGQRIERYGAWQKTAGENIAYGAESARDVVIQLIVDDGVASRGHRKNIFNADFLVVGVAFGTHPGYRTICVQDFAGGYTER